MPSLFRLLRNSSSQIKSLRHSNYYTSGRTLMGSPEEQPVPKHIYQYYYVFDYYPEALGAFNVYSLKRDQFAMEHFFALENFDFRYDGEQWNIGSFGWHLFFFFFPFLSYVILSMDDWSNQKHRSARNLNYCHHGGVLLNDMVLFEREPPIIQPE